MFFLQYKIEKQQRNYGQLIRIIASILYTYIWVPAEKTGGTNISPIKSIPIRTELQKYF
ncbi:DUF3703 domain-containing protein [Polaribacter sp. IC066]|nr:DUF3703 domain-containing protein [Polaribacter sp. IC063]TXD59692.1 DUF3703 domain-containing protein [Polaribacter sp. IC066]